MSYKIARGGLFILMFASFMFTNVYDNASAVSITFQYSGQVVLVDPELSSFFNTSQSILGTYTFESTTVKTSSSTDFGSYVNAMFTGGDVTIGGELFTLNPSGVASPIIVGEVTSRLWTGKRFWLRGVFQDVR
jgi:hypothetical protein